MPIEMPHFQLPNFQRGSITRDIDLPKVDLPKVDLPHIDLPKIDLSKVEIPHVDLPAIGRRIDSAGRDLKSLRLVREPSATEARARAAGTAGVWLLGGLGVGMAVMYFFDPRDGRSRRDRLVARINDLVRSAREAISGGARNIDDEMDRGYAYQPATTSQDVDAGLGEFRSKDLDGETPDGSRTSELASSQGGPGQF